MRSVIFIVFADPQGGDKNYSQVWGRGQVLLSSYLCDKLHVSPKVLGLYHHNTFHLLYLSTVPQDRNRQRFGFDLTSLALSKPKWLCLNWFPRSFQIEPNRFVNYVSQN